MASHTKAAWLSTQPVSLLQQARGTSLAFLDPPLADRQCGDGLATHIFAATANSERLVYSLDLLVVANETGASSCQPCTGGRENEL